MTPDIFVFLKFTVCLVHLCSILQQKTDLAVVRDALICGFNQQLFEPILSVTWSL